MKEQKNLRIRSDYVPNSNASNHQNYWKSAASAKPENQLILKGANITPLKEIVESDRYGRTLHTTITIVFAKIT